MSPDDARALGASGYPAWATTPISGVAYDSRKVRPGDLFFAWRGRSTDGHAYIFQALRDGAAMAIGHAPQSAGDRVLLHPDPKALMGRVARAFHHDPAAAMTLCAVTGTNGKTTTAHILGHMLAAVQGQAGLLGTLGAATTTAGQGAFTGPAYGTGDGLTTPQSVDLLAQLAAWRDQKITAVALEASSIALVEGRLDVTPVDVAIMTNLSHDHLDYHGTMAHYLAAKGLLFSKHLKAGGTGVLPWALRDEKVLQSARMLTYGVEALGDDAVGADVRVLGSAQDIDRGLFEVAIGSQTYRVQSPLWGRYNAENVAAALAAAVALGLPLDACVRGLAAMHGVPGRLERVQGSQMTPVVLVDFAHTPDALGRVLQTVRAGALGRVLVVVGCGGDRDAAKRPLMGEMAARADVAFLTSDNPRTESPEAIVMAMAAGYRRVAGAGTRSLTVQLDRAQAIDDAIAQARAGDVVLIAGKGHEPYQDIAGTKHPFDDRDQARRALLRHHPGAAPSSP